jgi:hypothetical protein
VPEGLLTQLLPGLCFKIVKFALVRWRMNDTQGLEAGKGSP